MPETQELTYAIKEAGIDWLTVTCEAGETQEQFDDTGYRLLQWERSEGNECKPWRFAGFEGLFCGGAALGKRDSLSVMRLSSVLAHQHWKRVYELATNCSRIDVQVTVSGVSNPAELIIDHHTEALAHIANRIKPPHVGLRLSNQSSPTVYFNQRVSDRFGRIYDKGNESRLAYYEQCVRYEVQFNNRAARAASFALAGSDRANANAQGFVRDFFTTRGISCRWANTERQLFSLPRRRSNADRSLEWLRRQVSPAVRDLLERGRVHEVVEALGLSEFVTVRPTKK